MAGPRPSNAASQQAHSINTGCLLNAMSFAALMNTHLAGRQPGQRPGHERALCAEMGIDSALGWHSRGDAIVKA
jgi:hypothetical protein